MNLMKTFPSIQHVLTAYLLFAIFSGETSTADEQTFFENEVRPLLLRECIDCHGEKKQEASLRLDHIDGFLKGGDSGSAIVPREPDQSLLIKAINYSGDTQMPPEKKLTADEIQVLTKWVSIGAPWFGDKPKNALRSGPPTMEERQHWAYQPLLGVAPPQIEGDRWSRNDIDRYVYAKWAEQGIQPAQRADDLTLLRRLHLDLTGLPPTPEVIAKVKESGLPTIYRQLVDTLLQSQQYGEQWGRHWLDVARYADTAGETGDYPVREAYKYRNYVIRSFMNNKPYDQFVAEQIAGDILAQSKTGTNYTDSITGTGFLAISRRFGFDPENYHHLTIQDTIDTVGQSFLGLTLGCARCHDHKYDPITIEDYYALYGIFESTTYAYPGSEGTKQPSAFPSAISASELEKALATRAQQLAEMEEELLTVQERKSELEAAGAALFALDAGFELQKDKTRLGTPWTAVDGVNVSTAAQSPYKNVLPYGELGLHIAGGSQNLSFSRSIDPPLNVNTANHYFTNIDFQVLEGENGAFRFYWGHGPGTSAAAMVSIANGGIAIWDHDQYRRVADIEVGRWYNLSVQLNLGPRTYSVSLSTASTHQHFSQIRMNHDWNGTLDMFFQDRFGHQTGNTPPRQIDNVIISSKPLPTLSEAHDTPLSSAVRENPYAHNLFTAPLAETTYDPDGHTGFFVCRLSRQKECSIGVNISDQEIKIPGTVPPGQLVFHPSNDKGMATAWTVPANGDYKVTIEVADAHICGDSVHWYLSRVSKAGAQALANRSVEANGSANYSTPEDGSIKLESGDLLLLAFDPKVNYGCDLTQLEFKITNAQGVSWSLNKDFLDAAVNRTFSNPLQASNGGHWWFFEPSEQLGRDWKPAIEVEKQQLTSQGRELALLNAKMIELTNTITMHKEAPDGPKVYGVAEGTVADAQIRIRGERHRLGDKVQRRNIEILGGHQLSDPTNSSGRLDLARWIIQDNKHLLARVMVNRIWQYHFGRGLVLSPNDFGTRGTYPSHPQLLDFLAQTFIDSGFNINQIHYLILESATYQQSSINTVVDESLDPSNRLIWKFNARRIPAENIRDSWMHVAGTLDSSMGGEHPFPPVSSWGFSQHAPFYGDYDHNHRSVYLMTQRIRRHPFLALFDGADTNASTPLRVETTVPTQSLYLLNSEFVHMQATAAAKLLTATSDDFNTRLDSLYQRTLTRNPSSEERENDLSFITSYKDELSSEMLDSAELEIRTWAALTRVLITSNEFLTIE